MRKVPTNLVPGSYDVADAVLVQTNGRIVTAGYTSAASNRTGHDIGVVRYTSRGTLDASFGTNGKVVTDLGGPYDEAHGLALQPNGRVVVAGTSDAHKLSGAWEGQSDPDFALLRYRN